MPNSSSNDLESFFFFLSLYDVKYRIYLTEYMVKDADKILEKKNPKYERISIHLEHIGSIKSKTIFIVIEYMGNWIDWNDLWTTKL